MVCGTAVGIALTAAALCVASCAASHDPVSDHTFTVNGQNLDCGPSGAVLVDAMLFSPGPGPAFFLDGDRIDAEYPGGDPSEYRPTRAPTFSCADGETHHLHIEVGHSPVLYNGWCSVRLEPAVQIQRGKSSPQPPGFGAPGPTCDLTWTD